MAKSVIGYCRPVVVVSDDRFEEGPMRHLDSFNIFIYFFSKCVEHSIYVSALQGSCFDKASVVFLKILVIMN